MRRILNYTLLITLMLPLAAQAQETQEPLLLSVDDAMRLAVKNNIETVNARLDSKNQDAVNAEVTGIALPQISAKGEFNDYLNPVQSFVPAEFVGGPPGTFIAVPFTPKYGATASATASQVLFDGSVMVALQAKSALTKLFERKERFTEEQVRYNIQKAYYALVVAEKQYKTLKESMSYMRTIGKEIQAYYDNGLGEKIDADRISVQVNNLASDSIKVGNMISVSKQMLKFQLGLDLDIPIILTDTSVNENVADAEDMLLQQMSYTDRTDYMLLKSQMEVNQYDLKRHKLSGLPSLAAFGTAAYTYQTNTFSDIFESPYIFYSLIGLQLNVPIFDGLQRRNRVKQAKISVQQSMNKLDNMERNIDLQTKQSKTTLKNALYTMENQRRNFDLAKEVMQTSRKKYNAGVGSSMEVSQSQTDMLQAQSNYFDAMLQVINARADLQNALGQFK